MTEIEVEIKEKILDLFDREREKPNLDFAESHFLDFLSYPPHSKDTIKNSFKGARRYYRFMDKLELEFGICFTLSDLDKYYSVDNLTKKVLERQQKKKGNLLILKQRNEEKENYWIESVLVLILTIIYIWLGFHWLPILLTVIFAVIVWWTISSKIYNRQHNEKLNLIIGKEK